MLYSVTKKISLVTPNSGVLSLIATLLIWSSYFVALRSGAQSSLSSFDMALLRFILPAVILLPLIVRRRQKILQVKKRYLVGVMAGAGLPFYLLSVLASGRAEAVVGSLLVPGVAPVFVTLIAVIFYKQGLSLQRVIGLSAVILGISLLILATVLPSTSNGLDYITVSSDQRFIGIALYILAALCWAIYTISVRLAGLTGLELAAVLNSSAAIVLLLVMPFDIFPSQLFSVSWQVVIPQLMVMGIFCGLISVVTYGHAINRLGAEVSACWGAITPVLVAIIAWIILGEALDLSTIAAVVIICLGVYISQRK